MKKYGFVILLIIFCHPVLAGCYFAQSGTNFIFAPSWVQDPVTLENNTNEPQQIGVVQVLRSEPTLRTYYSEDYKSDMNVFASGAVKPLSIKASNGALLFPVNLNGESAASSGYAIALQVNNSVGRSAYITDLSSTPQPLFSNLDKSECDNQTWYMKLELWHVGNYYRNEKKYSAITLYSGTYFRLQFDGDYDKSDAFIGLAALSIPVKPTTCNLAVPSPTVDFGEVNAKDKDSTIALQQFTLISGTCSQLGMAEMRILSNGNPVGGQGADGSTYLLNKLTGDDAAQGVGVEFSTRSRQMHIDSPLMDVSNCDSEDFDSNGFIRTCRHYITASLKQYDYTVVPKGEFEATATFSVTYY